MALFHFTYVREQRVYLDVHADNEEDAWEDAREMLGDLRLGSIDDSSDDPGELLLDGAEEHQ